MLNIAVIAITYIARFTSPSDLRIAVPTLLYMNIIMNVNTIPPYSNACCVAVPAPIICSSVGSRRYIAIDPSAEMITVSTRLCRAVLFASGMFFAPTNRAIILFAPAPIPFPSPTSIMNSGVMNPIAASASLPSPATHMLSARLYAMIRNMLTIIGHASFFIATL